jgi:alkanesulfonate monooxygenase SsuD/methylene tetrahydromethanopterin reductase-like flavin-dependent oxidoreductase (luciferase family)
MATGRRPFKIGIFIQHVEEPWSGRAIRWNELRAIVTRAEAIGFDSVWLPDHLIYRFPGVHAQGAWDVWSLMAGLAAVTKRVEIGPLVSCASFRNPALIAKMADTMDEISSGRFILGLGAGWHRPEYDAFGFPYDHRVSRFEEALTIISGLLKTGQVDFEGRFYSARECELRPRGPRPQGPPIVVGSNSPRMMRLMAMHADAWNSDRRNDVDQLLELQANVDGACASVGRDPATLDRVVGIQVDVLNEQREAFNPRQFIMYPWPISGSPEQIAERIRDYTRAHINHMLVWIDPVSAAGIEAFGPVLELIDG